MDLIGKTVGIVFGLCWGSFLGAVKDRIEEPASILKDRSLCPECKKTLRFFDLIPILSFLFLGGKCRYCRKRIALYHIFFEIVCGALAAVLFFRFGVGLRSFMLFLSFSFLFLASYLDAKDQEVNLWIFVLGLILSLFFFFGGGIKVQNFKELLGAVLGSALIPFLLFSLSREKWLGLGDVFFAVWIGIICGFPLSVVALFLAFLSGAIFGIILIGRKRHKKERAIAFGPFLAASGFIALLFGDKLLDLYLKFIRF